MQPTNVKSPFRVPRPKCQTEFPHVIGLCAISFDVCMHELLDLFKLLQTYWDESRQHDDPYLQPACDEFVRVARDSLRRAAALGQYRRTEWPGVEYDHDVMARQASEFIKMIERAIATRHRWHDGDVELAIRVLRLASSLVQQIPWNQLPESALQQNQDALERILRSIGRKWKCWNDKYWNNLVRRVLRAEAQLLKTRAKGGR